MLDNRFIDWLSAYQDHPSGGLPVVGEHHVSRSCIETGELVRESTSHKQHEGSNSSSLIIRCDGTRVSISGNPSRFNRPDNLFGFPTFDECFSVFNQILIFYGLPPFTKATSNPSFRQGREGTKSLMVSDGAVITRVDWTRNLTVGKGSVPFFIRGFSSRSMGKGILPFLFPNGRTLEWKASFWRHKLYNKSLNLIDSSKNKKITSEHSEYLNRLASFCDDHGVVRDEKEFKQPFLNKYGLQFYGLVKENDFHYYLNDINELLSSIDMTHSEHIAIADQLIDAGVCRSGQSANSTRAFHDSWLHGRDVKKSLRTYYRHKKRLLQIGIDISIPHNPTNVSQIKIIREITVGVLSPPDWYEMPKAPSHLQLVG